MKKLFTIAVFLLVWSSYSQNKSRNLFINNQSSFGMDIGEIKTKPTTGTYPHYISRYIVNGVNTKIHLNPLQSLVLISPYVSTTAARFPFYSPTSVPYINFWTKTISATSGGNVASSTLNTVLANNQLFDYIKFQMGTNGNAGGATLYFPAATIPTTDVVTYTGTGWIAFIGYTSSPSLPYDASISIDIYDN